MLWLRHYLKNHRGQAMVEFALVIPVLLLLIAGVMDFSLILNQYMVVAEASREGARSAALGGNDATVIAAAKAAATPIDTGNLQVMIAPSAPRVRGTSVTVTVSNPVKTLTQMVGVFFSTNFAVTGVTVMRVE